MSCPIRQVVSSLGLECWCNVYPPDLADRKNLSGDGNSLILSPTALKIPLLMV
uniref:Uncharacterized protein n=1 Tax=Anguilla anguilla TaxID=7936 RepID=A0A0E9U889_ANGAN